MPFQKQTPYQVHAIGGPLTFIVSTRTRYLNTKKLALACDMCGAPRPVEGATLPSAPGPTTRQTAVKGKRRAKHSLDAYFET
jgi:hypothetical protein